MRSLQDWMKYIDQQEQTVQEGPVAEQAVAAREIPLEDVPFPPRADSPSAAVQGPQPPKTSGKANEETREQLLQRLLDPMVSLEEAAKLLDVCPTTVRRYTNKGLLKHHRTAGNQRRFKLSDVLSFLEAYGR